MGQAPVGQAQRGPLPVLAQRGGESDVLAQDTIFYAAGVACVTSIQILGYSRAAVALKRWATTPTAWRVNTDRGQRTGYCPLKNRDAAISSSAGSRLASTTLRPVRCR